MTDGGDKRALIAAARRGLSPTAADRERVRRATLAALALAPVAAVPDVQAAIPTRTASWATRLAAVSLVAATAGSVCYVAGFHAGRRRAAVESAAAVSPPAGTAAPPPSAATRAGPNGGRAPVPPEAAVRPASVRPSHPASRPRATVEPDAQAEAPTASPASLAKELEALRAVERALREGNPAFARSLLRELDRTVPNGRLLEERLATLTIARCASGDVPLGVDMAEDFADRYPDSVYARRVFDACAGTDPARAGDSASRR